MSAGFEHDPEFHEPIKKPGPKRGFRLSELLVVLAIIAVLFALLLPATRSARPAARRAQCTNNLKQIALALYNYQHVNGALPPAHTVDADGKPLHSWRTLILPYLEQEALYRAIDLSKPWDDPANARALETPVLAYRCPGADGPEYKTTYLAIVGPDGYLLPRKPRRLEEITDGHGSTISVVEAGDEYAVPWMAPVDTDGAVLMSIGPSTKLHHPGGTQAAFVDGSVHFLKTSIRTTVRRALLTISGKDDPPANDW